MFIPAVFTRCLAFLPRRCHRTLPVLLPALITRNLQDALDVIFDTFLAGCFRPNLCHFRGRRQRSYLEIRDEDSSKEIAPNEHAL